MGLWTIRVKVASYIWALTFQYGSAFVDKISVVKLFRSAWRKDDKRSRTQNQRHIKPSSPGFPRKNRSHVRSMLESRFSCGADPTIRKSTRKVPPPPPPLSPLCDKWTPACLRSESTNIDYILHIVYIVQRRSTIGIDGHALFIWSWRDGSQLQKKDNRARYLRVYGLFSSSFMKRKTTVFSKNNCICIFSEIFIFSLWLDKLLDRGGYWWLEIKPRVLAKKWIGKIK